MQEKDLTVMVVCQNAKQTDFEVARLLKEVLKTTDSEEKLYSKMVQNLLPEVLILQSQTNYKVSDIVSMQQQLYLKQTSKFVIILNSIEKMGAAVANRLLKTIEESPSGVWFILTTNNISKVIPTIKSRCHKTIFCQEPSKETCENFFVNFFSKELSLSKIEELDLALKETPLEIEQTLKNLEQIFFNLSKISKPKADIVKKHFSLAHSTSLSFFWKKLFLNLL